MEDEELLNMILETLYYLRFEKSVDSLVSILQENDLFARKNQLRRVVADLTNNGFVIASSRDDDFEIALTP
ncbi:MAG: hypothetical protein KDC92_14265, partial [Bacteroidetes bacterium]|nr:hypothetical protein [Bacteroidota bacterium]